MVYDTKALSKKELEMNLQKFLSEGWELIPGTTKDQYKNLSDDKIVYIRRQFGDL